MIYAIIGAYVLIVIIIFSRTTINDFREELSGYAREHRRVAHKHPADVAAERNFKIAYTKEPRPEDWLYQGSPTTQEVFSHYVPAFNVEKKDD